MITVATAGGCDPVRGRPRAGWGFASDELRQGNACGALAGPVIQGGEVCAVAHAAARATTRIFIMTDSHNVDRNIGALCGGGPVVGDLGSVVRLAIHKVHGIRWVKAHLTDRETADMGHSPGCLAGRREGHSGSPQVGGGPGAHAFRDYRDRAAAERQRNLLDCYKAVRAATEHGGPSPVDLRSGTGRRAPGPPTTHAYRLPPPLRAYPVSSCGGGRGRRACPAHRGTKWAANGAARTAGTASGAALSQLGNPPRCEGFQEE